MQVNQWHIYDVTKGGGQRGGGKLSHPLAYQAAVYWRNRLHKKTNKHNCQEGRTLQLNSNRWLTFVYGLHNDHLLSHKH